MVKPHKNSSVYHLHIVVYIVVVVVVILLAVAAAVALEDEEEEEGIIEADFILVVVETIFWKLLINAYMMRNFCKWIGIYVPFAESWDFFQTN